MRRSTTVCRHYIEIMGTLHPSKLRILFPEPGVQDFSIIITKTLFLLQYTTVMALTDLTRPAHLTGKIHSENHKLARLTGKIHSENHRLAHLTGSGKIQLENTKN